MQNQAKTCLKIGLTGESSVLKSLAAVILEQPDWCLTGVLGDSSLREFASTRNITVADSRESLESISDVVVSATGDTTQVTRIKPKQDGRWESNTHPSSVELPHRNVIAISRLVKEMADLTADPAPIERLTATVVRPYEAVDRQVDGLRPGVHDNGMVDQLNRHLKPMVNVTSLRCVTAPIKDYELLMLHCVLKSDVAVEDLRRGLTAAPRLMIGSSSDGFQSTADLWEYFRDSNRPLGEQWEVFVWRDSIVREGNDLYLVASHSSQALLVPELMDAIIRCGIDSTVGDEHQETANGRLNMTALEGIQ